MKCCTVEDLTFTR